MRDERAVAAVPLAIRGLLIASVVAQCAWHAWLPAPLARAVDLPAPPPVAVLATAALGESPIVARLLALWLQAFDNQPGVSIPFRELDYTRVIAWLRAMLALDRNAQYPLLAASRLYAEVPDPDRQRQMLAFVHDAFLEAPDARWQWLAHAVFIARHRLHDDALALRFADDLATLTNPAQVPGWARQMRIFVREDIGELEAARILLGGLIESGEVRDAAELRFLQSRLADLERRIEAGRNP